MWWVYLLECENQLTYIGSTNDVERRFEQHKCGKGAKFTRANKPLRILRYAPFDSRSEACKFESQLKKMPKAKKLAWALASSS